MLSSLVPHLAPFWNRPLLDYAYAAYDIAPFTAHCSHRRDAMRRLQLSVERLAKRSGFNDADARRVADQITVSPVIQSGPHCFLLAEPDAFYTHLFSLLGLREHGRKWHVAYHASTVTFAEKAKKGPGWLRLDGEALNIFGLSRRRMDSYSVCGFNGPYRFAFSNASGKSAPNAAAARLLAELPSTEFASAAEAIKAANQALWRRTFPSSVNLLQLDDLDVADLAADHLDDADSWMSRCFVGNGEFAEHLLDELDRLNAGPWAGWVRRTTDLFWALENGRIVPLHLADRVLRARAPSSVEIAFDRESLAAALRMRRIIPNLLTVFLLLSILPGVRVLGGCRQVVYYPLMRHLIAAALKRSGEVNLLNEMSADVHPGIWGHRVLKPVDGYPFGELEQSGGIRDILEAYEGLPLFQACGDLASFTGDAIWARLSEGMSEGTIDASLIKWA